MVGTGGRVALGPVRPDNALLLKRATAALALERKKTAIVRKRFKKTKHQLANTRLETRAVLTEVQTTIEAHRGDGQVPIDELTNNILARAKASARYNGRNGYGTGLAANVAAVVAPAAVEADRDQHVRHENKNRASRKCKSKLYLIKWCGRMNSITSGWSVVNGTLNAEQPAEVAYDFLPVTVKKKAMLRRHFDRYIDHGGTDTIELTDTFGGVECTVVITHAQVATMLVRG